MKLEEIKKLLDYNPTTGVFTWKVYRSPSCRAGHIANTLNDGGYIVITINRIKWYGHHLAWYFMTENIIQKPYELDHKNRIRTDNSFTNLRIATRSQNNINSKRKEGKYPRGVMKNKKKYTAYIDVSNKRYYLGTYNTVQEAKNIRDIKAKEYYGEFAE